MAALAGHGRRLGMAVAVCAIGLGGLAACGSSSSTSKGSSSTSGHVLLVGTFHGHAGKYHSIQDAVNAAQSGDWILVAPGDYHETADESQPPPAADVLGGVLITKPGLHLRGMDRSGVIVDGTKAGAPSACSADPAQ